VQVSDWAAAATAVGTLVLAVATFSSVRSANRAGRNAERAINVGLRPVLFASRPHETVQKIRWGDDHWTVLPNGQATVEEKDGVIYLAISLLNVGSGIAVLHGWRVDTTEILDAHASFEEMQHMAGLARPDPATFRPQTRDMYAPPGDVSFWHAAIRTANDPDRERVGAAIAGPQPLIIELLYSDQEGGQRTISRFSVTRYGNDHDVWYPSVVRHWYLDDGVHR
jgi:hypothetical protein